MPSPPPPDSLPISTDPDTSAMMRLGGIVGLALLPLLAQAAEPAEGDPGSCEALAARVGHGSILWTEGAVIVQGTAAPNLHQAHVNVSHIKRMTERAAMVDAYRKATALLAGVQVTADTDAATMPGATTAISGIVRGATACKTKFYADGGVDVAVKVPLTGAMLEDPSTQVGTATATGESAYTGILVDATKVPFQPAFVPRLLGPDGRVLFAANHLAPVAVRRGLPIAYGHPGAASPQRVGDNPLRVSAVATGPGSPSDLVLDAAAAMQLAGAPAFLGQGQIAIIIAEPAAIDCAANAAGVTDTQVDWQSRLVLARGKGEVDFTRDDDEAVQMRLMERASEVDAERLLVDRARKLSPNGTAPIQLVNSVRCGARFFRDGKAEVVLAAPIDRLGIDAPWNPAAEPGTNADAGLIIDATGVTGFVPSIAPGLRGPDAEVYGPGSVARPWGRDRGGAAFHTSVAAARTDPRTGPDPMVLTASGVDPDNPGVLLLNDDDANQVLVMGRALSSAPVAIVVAPEVIQQ